MTSKQDLPLQKIEQSKWSMRKLFPFASVKNAFTKTFINVFDILSLVLVVIIGVATIIGSTVSFGLYFITVFLIVCAFIERRSELLTQYMLKQIEKK